LIKGLRKYGPSKEHRLLSTDKPVSIKPMKSFNRFDEKNINLYNDRIYKIIPADKAFDLLHYLANLPSS